MQVVAFPLNHQSSSQNLFVWWVWLPLPHAEEFSIFNKHFKILSFFMHCLGPNITKLYFPQQSVLSGKVYMETCVWNFNPFGMHRKSLPIKGWWQHFENLRNHPFFNNPQTFKNWICLKQALPLSWLFFWDSFTSLFISTWYHWCSLNEVISLQLKQLV